MEARHIVIAAIAVVALAALLQIVGVATPNWLSAGDAGNLGLWQVCGSVCTNLGGDVDAWLKATRAFGVLAILVMGASVGLGAIIVIKPDIVMAMKLAPAPCGLGAMCSLISFAIFAGKYGDSWGDTPAVKFSYSFGLCVVAAILSGIAAVLFLFARKQQ